jgi:hypothetical protein
VKRIGEYMPWLVEGPVEMIIRYYPKDKETPASVLVYKGQNVLEAYEAWHRR